MQKRTIAGILAIMVLLLLQAPAMAGELDMLVEKLVDKGVLSKKDGDLILSVQKSEKDKANKELISTVALPAFIKNTQFKGDFRLRYESKERDGKADQHRGRYRFRLGGLTKIDDEFEVGYGLASGSADPRSTNQSFTNSFETPDIRLDYAYASYKPKSLAWLQLLGGQMPNPLWLPGGSFLWDNDIRPQGISAVMNRKFDGFELFMTSGFWILDEVSDREDDPVMWVAQPGYRVSLGKQAYFKNAVGLYQFSNVEGTTLDYSSKTNTLVGGKLADDYDSVVVSGELGYNTGIALMPFVSAYGEYVNNRTTSEDDSGYGCGIKIGHEKLKQGLWQAGVGYHRLERNAWLDIFPDSDTFSGGTNMKAVLAKVAYGLRDNIELGANYIASEQLSGASLDDDVFQVDMTFKF